MLFYKIYKIGIVPYTLALLYLMFFGFGRSTYVDNIVRIIPITSSFLFIKNKLLWQDYQNLTINMLGNIVMFIPFGFLGCIFPHLKNFKRLLMTFLSFIIIVEALQYFSRLGVFDIDDIILNSLGVAIGFFIFMKIEKRILIFAK